MCWSMKPPKRTSASLPDAQKLYGRRAARVRVSLVPSQCLSRRSVVSAVLCCFAPPLQMKEQTRADRYCCSTRQMRETDASVKSRRMKLQLESGTQNPPPSLYPLGTVCVVTSIKRRKEYSGAELQRLSQVIAHRRCSLVAAR